MKLIAYLSFNTKILSSLGCVSLLLVRWSFFTMCNAVMIVTFNSVWFPSISQLFHLKMTLSIIIGIINWQAILSLSIIRVSHSFYHISTSLPSIIHSLFYHLSSPLLFPFHLLSSLLPTLRYNSLSWAPSILWCASKLWQISFAKSQCGY